MRLNACGGGRGRPPGERFLVALLPMCFPSGISGRSGRVYLPRSLRPPIRTGGDEGWWTFQSLEVDDKRIIARISLNFINKPKIVVDRHTGDVDVSGFAEDFSGTCVKVDKVEAAAPKF